MNYIICNLAYGPEYSKLFLNNHLKSVLDETNLPEVVKNHKVDYYIFSERSQLEQMGQHDNVKALGKLVNVVGIPFVNPVGYQERYDFLGRMLRFGIKKSLEKDAIMTVFAADGVVAKGFFPKVLSHMEKGAGAVFTVPMRAAVEVCQETIDRNKGALTASDMFKLAYNNLHPLWNASHYEAAQFSKMPYTMLWNTGRGLMARSFSISPMVFKPTEAMRNVSMADFDLPGLCQNPVWLENWEDAPVAGFEPMTCYYPPFANHKATPEFIGQEFGKHIREDQMQFAKRKFYYPNKSTVNIDETSSNAAIEAVAEKHKLR